MTGIITHVKNYLCRRNAMGESDCQEHRKGNEMTMGSNGGRTPSMLSQWFVCCSELHLCNTHAERQCCRLNGHPVTLLLFLMSLFKCTASLLHPPVPLVFPWGRDKLRKYISVTNLWSNPSLEKRTWSLSTWLPAVLQTSTEPCPWFVTVRHEHVSCSGCVSPKNREGPCGP